ncbi:MAG: CRTAC1 family protein [Deltaproteobacteria bacterium]|nr:CRTAC1 family protein [Deltaproteobacteria bacterium]
MRSALHRPFLLVLLAGCGAEDERPPEICNEPPVLGDGPWFTEVTDALGLGPTGLAAQASSLSTADFDGDAWPDLYLSKGSSYERDDPADPQYFYRLLRNTQGTGYEDVTFSSGFSATRDGGLGRYGGNAAFLDLDNDGDPDAWCSASIESGVPNDFDDHSEVLLNQGDGTWVLGPETWFSNDPDYDPFVGLVAFDWNHDGILDLFNGHHYHRYGYYGTCVQDDLWRGDGSGGFARITEQAGMETDATYNVDKIWEGIDSRPTWGVTGCDIDGDGWTEIFTSTYGRGWNRMWKQDGSGVFHDVARDLGFASDANETYVDDEYYACHCHYFTDGSTCDPMPEAPQISCSALGGDPWQEGWSDQSFDLGGNSSNTVCGDLDNDGDLDLLQVELRHWHIGQASDRTELLYNDGPEAPFRRPGNEAMGLVREHATRSWNEGDLGGALFDFDNDGRLDVFVPSSDYPDTWSLLWRQEADGTFTEHTDDGGLRLDRAHGLTLADYDRDGDYDVFMGTSLMRWTASDDPPVPDAPYLHAYRNDVGQAGNKLMISLSGAGEDRANRDAFGARIVVTAGSDLYVREHVGPHGLGIQQHDGVEIIGVGTHCTVDRVEVRWPDAEQSVSIFEDVRANYVLHIHQDRGLTYEALEDWTGR